MVESVHPYVISGKMEQLMVSNFEVMEKFESHIAVLLEEDVSRNTVIGTLFGHFDTAFKKVFKAI